MAVDTPTKRKSIAAIGAMFVGPTVVPTGSFDQADRQVIGYSYSGILVGSGTAETLLDYMRGYGRGIAVGFHRGMN